MSFLWKYFKKGWALEWRDNVPFHKRIIISIIIQLIILFPLLLHNLFY